MKLAVETSGPADGTPFVWAHGMTSSMAADDDTGVFAWSSLDGIRLVRYDAPGHGRSPIGASAEDHRWDRLAVDMFAVADKAGFSTFVAGGASMGAATTLHAAVQGPDVVEAMVLVIPPTAWETRAAQAGVYQFAMNIVEEQGIEALIELEKQMPGSGPLADPAIRERFQQHLLDMAPRALARIFEGAIASDLPPREVIARLQQPTLILAWTDDPGHPVSTAEALHDLLPNSALHIAESLDEVRSDWPTQLQSWV
ncbi:MAG: 3-oxoadipate enol-lactonase, partial [Actinomycetota bacterium]